MYVYFEVSTKPPYFLKINDSSNNIMIKNRCNLNNTKWE